MRRRVLDLGLLAYPRELRDRDGEHLRDLALDLADDHGTARELLGLVWGGLGERGRQIRRPRLVAAGALTAVVLAALTMTATATSARVEEDRFACVGECVETRAAIADRVEDGWTCTGDGDATAAQWRCSRD